MNESIGRSAQAAVSYEAGGLFDRKSMLLLSLLPCSYGFLFALGLRPVTQGSSTKAMA